MIYNHTCMCPHLRSIHDWEPYQELKSPSTQCQNYSNISIICKSPLFLRVTDTYAYVNIWRLSDRYISKGKMLLAYSG